MASFFKGTCGIYWFIWLVCMSYYLGSAIYTSHYIMTTDATHLVFNYLRMVCLFNIALCFVGCIFIKFSITHVLCAILFVFPLLGVNLVGCILGISATRKVEAPTATEVITNIMKSLKDTGDYPNWFHNTQYWMGCCGVYSYLDYPLNLSKSKKSNTLSSVIPSTCCPENRGNPKCNLKLDNLNVADSADVPVFEILTELKRTCKNQEDIIPYMNQNTTFRPIPNISNIISTCGCIGEIEIMTDGLHQSHLIFFIIILIMALTMVGVYLKAWCRQNGGNTDSGSQHSLDIETAPSVHALIAASAPETLPAPSSAILPDNIPKGSSTQQAKMRSGSAAEVAVPPRILLNKTKAITNLRRNTIVPRIPKK